MYKKLPDTTGRNTRSPKLTEKLAPGCGTCQSLRLAFEALGCQGKAVYPVFKKQSGGHQNSDSISWLWKSFLREVDTCIVATNGYLTRVYCSIAAATIAITSTRVGIARGR